MLYLEICLERKIKQDMIKMLTSAVQQRPIWFKEKRKSTRVVIGWDDPIKRKLQIDPNGWEECEVSGKVNMKAQPGITHGVLT